MEDVPTSEADDFGVSTNAVETPVEAARDSALLPVAAAGQDAGGEPRRLPSVVVGLGGSSGSLDVLKVFFSQVPPDTGMAYVVVVHLSPEHESYLAEILQKSARIPVTTVIEPLLLESDHVYVIPPAKHLALVDGFIYALDMNRPKGRHVAVDLLFRTLADSYGSGAIAIVLSGGDGDGALGLKRVKELGGLTLAQDPTEAAFDSMPRAAIATGMVDWILPVEEMPSHIIDYQENGRRIHLLSHLSEAVPREEARSLERDESALREILAFLKARTGHDFSSYKRVTLLRRIGRRMQVNAAEDLDSYRAYLRAHPGETGALLQDLLISVTNFFRDPESFHALEQMVPEMFKGKGATDHIRVWVPACATGEEAYSVAMLLCEYAEKLDFPPQIQVFATDLDRMAIEVARDGKYPETISADVSEERLRRFFTKEPGSYRVRRAVREIVLFAVHDLLKNSPFSRLDLVCGRNLLIYLNRQAQAKVFDIFHFALRPGGWLFLGSSESAEEAGALFGALDKKHRIYTRRSNHRTGVGFPTGTATFSFAMQTPVNHAMTAGPLLPAVVPGITGDGVTRVEPMLRSSWAELHFHLIERVAPPSLVINREHEIVHLSKSVGRYLQFVGGEPSSDLLRTIHPGLRAELRAALFQVGKSAMPLQVDGLSLQLDGLVRSLSLTIERADEIAPDYLLILFHEQSADSQNSSVPLSRPPAGERPPPQASVLQNLEEELDQMKLRLRDTVDQYEASNEELKASNEELQAMNEELRSATEELETGREELQSINEEIITINQELKSKVEELSRSNSDLQNLMASTNIATIFLDRQLRIKRFTPSTTGLFNFIPSDVDRPLSDLTHKLDYPDIAADAAKVLDDLSLVEREVRDLDGRWFLSRLLPYRTTEDQIAGVVITCVDITARKSAEEAGRWLSVMVESSNDAIISFGMDDKIVSWNHGAEKIFGYTAQEMIGRRNSTLIPEARKHECGEILEKLKHGESVSQFETVRVRNDGKWIDLSLSSSVMRNEVGEIVGATMIAQDITVRKAAVEGLKQAKEELEARVEARTAELRKRASQISLMASDLTFTEQRERKRMAHILHDQFQQLLVAAKMRIESLAKMDEEGRARETMNLVRLMDEVL
jgi:two-component system CheB/CheR fusion protein